MEKFKCIKSFKVGTVKFIKGETYEKNGNFITDQEFTFGVSYEPNKKNFKHKDDIK